MVGLASSFGVDFHRLNVAAIEPAQESLLSDLEGVKGGNEQNGGRGVDEVDDGRPLWL